MSDPTSRDDDTHSVRADSDPREIVSFHSSDATEGVRQEGHLLDVARALAREGMIAGEPCRIGPYRLLGVLGTGGMGVVYLAEQDQPVHRKVALKITKPEMATQQFVARFKAERQALALMDHPNVSKVYDAGVTDDGRPYFAMEYVPGGLLTKYCDAHKLSIEQRLELFVDVCHAVQHAHQKGIIHRDIKPNNVLVTVPDEKPVVKVIDFGVAKAMGMRLTEETLYTEPGALIGTLEFMSPEQAEGSPDIDTRADVYSLGVMLYEFLTGSVPFDRNAIAKNGLRMIREDEPPKPSTRVASLDKESTTVAVARRTELRTLARALRGDLDSIVMKCLAKDRTLRYQSAGELAGEVGHYLAGEPIGPMRHSTLYLLRKLVRRHRGYLAVGALLAVATLVPWFWWQARAWKLDSLYRAGIDYGQREEWKTAERYFHDALAIDPHHVKNLLGLVWMKIGQLDDEPELGTRQAWSSLEEHCKTVLGQDPGNITALNQHGLILKALGRYDEAVQAYGKIIKQSPHSEKPAQHVAAAWSNLGTVYALMKKKNLREAEEHLRQGAKLFDEIREALSKKPDKDEGAGAAWRNLAALELYLQQRQDALTHVHHAWECNSTNAETYALQARIYLEPDTPINAAEAMKSAIAADSTAQGKNAHAKRMLALAYLRTGNLDQAIAQAHAAIGLHDMPTVNHLIMAIAEGQLRHPAEAQHHLDAAKKQWPDELKADDSFQPSAEKGVLWFESNKELESLREEAEKLLKQP